MIIDEHGNCLHDEVITTVTHSSGATSYHQVCADCGLHVAGFLSDDAATRPDDYVCPICWGAGCPHCGAGEVEPYELRAADTDDEDDEFAGDEWDRARDHAIDMAVGVW